MRQETVGNMLNAAHLSRLGYAKTEPRTCITAKPEAYRHDLPFSKGGTSLTAANVRIICMRCNLRKSNKILAVPPIFFS